MVATVERTGDGGARPATRRTTRNMQMETGATMETISPPTVERIELRRSPPASMAGRSLPAGGGGDKGRSFFFSFLFFYVARLGKMGNVFRGIPFPGVIWRLGIKFRMLVNAKRRLDLVLRGNKCWIRSSTQL